MPYSPSRYAVQGSTRFWSSAIESTISAAAAPGAYQADVPSSSTISPPPLRVRSTIAAIRSSEASWRRGTPPTVVAETTGTIWSPWPPRTTAVTSLADEPVSQAMNVRNRAVSRIPAMPTTRSRGHPEASLATWHMASRGFETTTRIASGERSTASRVTDPTICSLVVTRSSRLMPGLRGQAGGDHDDVGARGLVVVVGSPQVRLVAEHGPRLVQVERLPLRQSFLDVDEDDVGVVAPRDLLGRSRADVAGADDRDLSPQTRTPIRSMIASATSLVPTAVGSSRAGFMS